MTTYYWIILLTPLQLLFFLLCLYSTIRLILFKKKTYSTSLLLSSSASDFKDSNNTEVQNLFRKKTLTPSICSKTGKNTTHISEEITKQIDHYDVQVSKFNIEDHSLLQNTLYNHYNVSFQNQSFNQKLPYQPSSSMSLEKDISFMQVHNGNSLNNNNITNDQRNLLYVVEKNYKPNIISPSSSSSSSPSLEIASKMAINQGFQRIFLLNLQNYHYICSLITKYRQDKTTTYRYMLMNGTMYIVYSYIVMVLMSNGDNEDEKLESKIGICIGIMLLCSVMVIVLMILENFLRKKCLKKQENLFSSNLMKSNDDSTHEIRKKIMINLSIIQLGLIEHFIQGIYLIISFICLLSSLYEIFDMEGYQSSNAFVAIIIGIFIDLLVIRNLLVLLLTLIMRFIGKGRLEIMEKTLIFEENSCLGIQNLEKLKIFEQKGKSTEFCITTNHIQIPIILPNPGDNNLPELPSDRQSALKIKMNKKTPEKNDNNNNEIKSSATPLKSVLFNLDKINIMEQGNQATMEQLGEDTDTVILERENELKINNAINIEDNETEHSQQQQQDPEPLYEQIKSGCRVEPNEEEEEEAEREVAEELEEEEEEAAEEEDPISSAISTNKQMISPGHEAIIAITASTALVDAIVIDDDDIESKPTIDNHNSNNARYEDNPQQGVCCMDEINKALPSAEKGSIVASNVKSKNKNNEEINGADIDDYSVNLAVNEFFKPTNKLESEETLSGFDISNNLSRIAKKPFREDSISGYYDTNYDNKENSMSSLDFGQKSRKTFMIKKSGRNWFLRETKENFKSVDNISMNSNVVLPRIKLKEEEILKDSISRINCDTGYSTTIEDNTNNVPGYGGITMYTKKFLFESNNNGNANDSFRRRRVAKMSKPLSISKIEKYKQDICIDINESNGFDNKKRYQRPYMSQWNQDKNNSNKEFNTIEGINSEDRLQCDNHNEQQSIPSIKANHTPMNKLENSVCQFIELDKKNEHCHPYQQVGNFCSDKTEDYSDYYKGVRSPAMLNNTNLASSSIKRGERGLTESKKKVGVSGAKRYDNQYYSNEEEEEEEDEDEDEQGEEEEEEEGEEDVDGNGHLEKSSRRNHETLMPRRVKKIKSLVYEDDIDRQGEDINDEKKDGYEKGEEEASDANNIGDKPKISSLDKFRFIKRNRISERTKDYSNSDTDNGNQSFALLDENGDDSPKKVKLIANVNGKYHLRRSYANNSTKASTLLGKNENKDLSRTKSLPIRGGRRITKPNEKVLTSVDHAQENSIGNHVNNFEMKLKKKRNKTKSKTRASTKLNHAQDYSAYTEYLPNILKKDEIATKPKEIPKKPTLKLDPEKLKMKLGQINSIYNRPANQRGGSITRSSSRDKPKSLLPQIN